jgi:hypothetical protein
VAGEDVSGSESSDHVGEGVRGTSKEIGDIARVTGVDAKWTCLRSMAIACGVCFFSADLGTVVVVDEVDGEDSVVGEEVSLGEVASVVDTSSSGKNVAAATVGSMSSIAEATERRRKRVRRRNARHRAVTLDVRIF